MSEFYVAVGDEVTFSKTVGESDIYGFAGITGDLSPNHVNDQYMKASSYGQRIAHGALMVGYMSTTSTMMIAKTLRPDREETPVSAGYDRIRFTGAVYINDTITVTYRITSIEVERRRSRAEITVVNQTGDMVAVGEHILQWVPNT
ncbi:MAG: MaoC/PaaZ C-terminal domain-containing protein [Pseudomonadota bacterium]|nr:MaoC/PaaZ C-terminal domain-containing protein [Pseudomonadota bacterium]